MTRTTADPGLDQQHAAARDWLWQHTAQPNGQPWDADTEHLTHAATALVQQLAPAAASWRTAPVRGGAQR